MKEYKLYAYTTEDIIEILKQISSYSQEEKKIIFNYMGNNIILSFIHGLNTDSKPFYLRQIEIMGEKRSNDYKVYNSNYLTEDDINSLCFRIKLLDPEYDNLPV